MTTLLPTRLATAIPASLAEIAAQAAFILDPDTGGALTYTDAYSATINGALHYRADLPMWTLTPGDYPALDALGMTSYADILRSRSPDLWFAVLTQLAAERGREFTLSPEQVAELAGAMLFDEEINTNAET
jgi:spermidine/putrescine-binding protein